MTRAEAERRVIAAAQEWRAAAVALTKEHPRSLPTNTRLTVAHKALAAAVDALPDALPDTGEADGSRWRHKKRGTTYKIIGEAKVQSGNAIFEDEIVVVYRADSDGTLWVRPHYEFNDGRFESIPSPPTNTGEK
jgi:hypothetical protein